MAVPAGASIEPFERRAEAPREKKRSEEKRRAGGDYDNSIRTYC